MGRGAPQGNQYAKKAAGESKRGVTLSFTHYLDSYELEFLQKSIELDGDEVTPDTMRKKLRQFLKKSIEQEMGRVFALYREQREQEERK